MAWKCACVCVFFLTHLEAANNIFYGKLLSTIGRCEVVLENLRLVVQRDIDQWWFNTGNGRTCNRVARQLYVHSYYLYKYTISFSVSPYNFSLRYILGWIQYNANPSENWVHFKISRLTASRWKTFVIMLVTSKGIDDFSIKGWLLHTYYPRYPFPQLIINLS